jgi:hypothetical protein
MKQLAVTLSFIGFLALLGRRAYGQGSEEAGALRVSATLFRLEVAGSPLPN